MNRVHLLGMLIHGLSYAQPFRLFFMLRRTRRPIPDSRQHVIVSEVHAFHGFLPTTTFAVSMRPPATELSSRRSPEELVAIGCSAAGRDHPLFLHPRTGDEAALEPTERTSRCGRNGPVFNAIPKVTLSQHLAVRDLTT